MLQLIAKNQKPPFQDFYADHFNRVVAYINNKISNHHDAEDLAEEVFVYCYAHYDDYDPEKASITTWLYMIVNSRIKNHYRDSREHVDLEVLSNVLPDENSDMENAVYLDQISMQLKKAISRLPEKQQRLVMLHYFEEKTSTEIAQIMGMTPINVRVQLSRALDKLEKLCAGILEGDR